MLKTIDGSFALQSGSESPIVKIIQSNYSMSYDLNAHKRVSGPDSLLTQYSYDFNKMGPIAGAFRRNNDAYFLSNYYYYVWKSDDGKTGVLGEGQSITKELYKCKTKFDTTSTKAWPFVVPTTTLGTPIPMFDDDDEISTSSEANGKLIGNSC